MDSVGGNTSKRVAKNTLFMYVRMFLTLGVTLYISRVALDALGVSDYGAYNVVGGIVAMFGFFNMAMSSATQRFLSYEIGKGDFKKLRLTFSASVTIHIVIAFLVLLFAETVGIWFVNNKLNIAPESRESLNWVYQFSIFSFLVTILQVPYNALIIANEKMSIYAFFSIVEVLLKLLIAYLLFVSPYDKLKSYAVLMFMVTFVVALIYRVYCMIKFKESAYKYSYDPVLYKSLIGFSGWSLFGNLAMVARLQGSNVVLNIVFGTVINASYSIASQVNSAVRMFVSNFQIALNPQIIKTYASNDLYAHHKLINQGSRISYFLLLIIICPIWLNLDFILNLWLGIIPDYVTVFIKLAFINLLVDCISGPMIISVQATGKVKWYQIILGSFVLLDLPITYMVVSKFDKPELSFVVTILITFFSLIIRIFFLKKLTGLNVKTFINAVLFRIILVTLFSASFMILLLNTLVLELDWLKFLASSFFVTLFNIIMIYLFGVTKDEKLMFNLHFKKYKNKNI